MAEAEQEDEARPSEQSQSALDWLNFFIADVQTAFGPFVAVYLIASGWSQGGIGLLLAVGTIVGIAGELPGGAIVDAVASKRLLIAIALGMIFVGAVIFAASSNAVMIYAAEILHGSTAGIIRPAEVAIGLGLVGHRALSPRLGRNHRYQAFGNAATAAAMGLLGYFLAPATTFLAAAALCVPAAYMLTRIRGEEIDYARARAARDRRKPREVAALREVARHRLLLIFVASLVLFQLANASLTPLATERLGQEHRAESELFTAGLVIVPQVVTALLAAWIARRAGDWGRKPLLLAGYAVLPLRGSAVRAGAGAVVDHRVPDDGRSDRRGDRHPDAARHLRRDARQRPVLAQGVAETAQESAPRSARLPAATSLRHSAIPPGSSVSPRSGCAGSP